MHYTQQRHTADDYFIHQDQKAVADKKSRHSIVARPPPRSVVLVILLCPRLYSIRAQGSTKKVHGLGYIVPSPRVFPRILCWHGMAWHVCSAIVTPWTGVVAFLVNTLIECHNNNKKK